MRGKIDEKRGRGVKRDRDEERERSKHANLKCFRLFRGIILEFKKDVRRFPVSFCTHRIYF